MLISRKYSLSINLITLLLCSSMGYAATSAKLPKNSSSSSETISTSTNPNKSFAYLSFLYVQPNSDNLKYATFVSGTQPFTQSWHYQSINPDYHPAFELGFNYAIPRSDSWSSAIYWTHINTNDSGNKQASTNTDLSTVEFVGPPFEMSPPVFGIKRVDATVNFAFDNVLLNISKIVAYSPNFQARFFGGLDILNLNQTLTTTFSDYAGSPPTAYSYATPPDPSFSFELENTSKYLGAGPDLGFTLEYTTDSGFGILAQAVGSLTAGVIKTEDDFTSTAARLTENGIGTSHQQITAPNATQIVLGGDGKVGVFYNYHGFHLSNLRLELGYRIATYLNAISTVVPNTLVQPGTVVSTPEFATGTMAIVSTNASTHPFSFNGPFLDLLVDIA